MGEAFIFGNGGGGNDLANAYAIILVEYPAGSTATCTNAATGKTYKAGNTYGAWSFGVNSSGTWTVTSTNGNNTASKSVEITASGQAINIKVQYEWYFFKEGEGLGGNIATRLAGTLTTDSNSIKIVSGQSGSYSMIISPAVPNIKDYKTLRVEANVGNGYGTCTFGLCNSADTTYDQLKSNINVIAKLAPSAKNARNTYTIDLTSISASETNAYFYTLCSSGPHTTYFYDIVALP